jgi:predicted DCC family thiol-disulfide oxidoreductase YuxK
MRVNDPPDQPTLLFDGQCGFCRKWVHRLAASSHEVETRSYQEARHEFPEIPEAACASSVQLIKSDGTVVSGAEAAIRFWSTSSIFGRIARTMYRGLPGFSQASEAGYRVIAASRPAASAIVRLMWGGDMFRPGFRVSGDLFLRLLGLIYAAAFLSLVVQIQGLIGNQGILPLEQTLQIVRERFGVSSTFEFPSLLWLWSSDLALVLLCLAGAVTGLVGFLMPYVWLPWLVSWVCYLSLVSVGRAFLSFQWDALLLEIGFLAVLHTLVHARGWSPRSKRNPIGFSASPHPMRAISWAYRWLLFRLMFASGVVKLASNDEAWWNLTALTRYYETQPLPNAIAWYVHHLPEAFHTFSCLVTFGIEILVPFLFFAPRRLRHLAAVLTIGLQILILLTGNYTFFNLLSIALCLWLIEDAAYPAWIRDRFQNRLATNQTNILRKLTIPAICLNLVFSTMLLTRGAFRLDIQFPDPVRSVYGWIAPYRILNTYGLFAVMTTDRPEIILEGSSDGDFWKSYEFFYKPGDIHRAPPFVAPHQPRLDWQMWFAALGPIRNSPWFYGFAQRLFEGSPSVKKLLAQDPFPNTPPRYLRAHVFDYRFSSPEQRAKSGAWWTRSFSHVFMPPITQRP